MQFCTTERPQLFEFEMATCRTCRLRSDKVILEVATSNLQKWRGFAKSWGSLHADLTPPNLHSCKIWLTLSNRSYIGAFGRSQDHGGQVIIQGFTYIPGKMEGVWYVTLDSDGPAYTRRLLLCFLWMYTRRVTSPFEYRTRAIITRSWLETALEY